MSGKAQLLNAVVVYAKNFQQTQKRKKMTSQNIHDALFALGLRPLYGITDSTDAVVSCAEIVGATDDLCVPPNAFTISTHLYDSDWTVSVLDNFKKRHRKAIIFPTESQLSEKTKFYIKSVINDISSGHNSILVPSSTADLLVASWFIGLFFTETVLTEETHWMLIRSAIEYLQRALANMPRGHTTLFDPWLRGLACVADGTAKLVECDSEQQMTLIQTVCQDMYRKLDSK